MGKTTKMRFTEDKFVNGVIFANKGEVVDVPNESVDRWIVRGGVIVGDNEDTVKTPEVKAEKKELDKDEVPEAEIPKKETPKEAKGKTKSK